MQINYKKTIDNDYILWYYITKERETENLKKTNS